MLQWIFIYEKCIYTCILTHTFKIGSCLLILTLFIEEKHHSGNLVIVIFLNHELYEKLGQNNN